LAVSLSTVLPYRARPAVWQQAESLLCQASSPAMARKSLRARASQIGSPTRAMHARAAVARVVAESASHASEPACVVDESAFPLANRPCPPQNRPSPSPNRPSPPSSQPPCSPNRPPQLLLRGSQHGIDLHRHQPPAQATVLGEMSSGKETKCLDNWPCEQASKVR
jgi:hypothetical protein